MMKKLVLAVLFLMVTTTCFAGVKIYEKGDWKVGIDEATPFVGYDVNHRDWIGGMKTSIVQYKEIWNFDVGLVTDMEEADDQTGEDLLDAVIGLSVDLPSPMQFNDNLYASVGLFCGDKIGDLKLKKETVRYGIYGGVTIKF